MLECRCRKIAFKLSDNDEFRFAEFKELHFQACKLHGKGLNSSKTTTMRNSSVVCEGKDDTHSMRIDFKK